MKIAMINGSPKRGNSNSGRLLKRLEGLVDKEHEIKYYNINIRGENVAHYEQLCDADILILAFPLYIDAIPSHLFRWMLAFEEYRNRVKGKDIWVYAIINNGFYEGSQNKIAVQILQNWCKRAGLTFGMAIGTGAGEMIGSIENVPLGHGPLKNLGEAMENLMGHAKKRETGQSLFINPNFPRLSWKFIATHFVWNKSAKRNGLKKKEMKQVYKAVNEEKNMEEA